MKISEFPTVPPEQKKSFQVTPTESQRGQDDAVTQALKIASDMGRRVELPHIVQTRALGQR